MHSLCVSKSRRKASRKEKRVLADIVPATLYMQYLQLGLSSFKVLKHTYPTTMHPSYSHH